MYVLEMIFLGKLKRLKVCTSSENWDSLFSEKDWEDWVKIIEVLLARVLTAVDFELVSKGLPLNT